MDKNQDIKNEIAFWVELMNKTYSKNIILAQIPENLESLLNQPECNK